MSPPEVATADTVTASYAPGDQFVIDGQLYTAAGAADATPGSAAVGLFAYNPSGTLVFISTTDVHTSESLYINYSQSDTICFMAGTHIATRDGSVSVEDLSIGDLVLTSAGAESPIRWVGRQTVSTTFADPKRVMPIRIKHAALDHDLPKRDLLVSPCHAILVEGVLVQAGALVNGTTIVRETDVPTTFVYYHVELEDHSLILAEGVPAETFVDNIDRLAFDNWAEHQRLYPEGRSIKELPYARAASSRQVPASTMQKIAARSDVIAGQASAAA